jgi:hypothetical protein
MGKARDGLDMHLNSKQREYVKRLLAMNENEPSSDQPIGNQPTIYDTLEIIRVGKIERFYRCKNTKSVNSQLSQRIYGHIMLHSEDRNLLFTQRRRIKLRPELTEALKHFFASVVANKQIITFHGANIDDAVREAGDVQFIKEVHKNGKTTYRNLY